MKSKKYKTPIIAKFILSFFLNHSHPEEMLGDYDEIYFDLLKEKSFIIARLWYWFQIILLIPPFFKNSIYWSVIMLKNYFKITFRNIKKHRTFSVINISGLAIGMAGFILISIFIFEELSYDKYHEKANRIFRVGAQYDASDNSKGAYTAPPMSKALKNDYPEVTQSVRINPWQKNRLISYKETKFLEKNILWADSNIFNVFTIPFTTGDPNSALSKPRTLVFTKSTAYKYFGNENPVGKFIKIDNDEALFEITGIIEDCPHNSHLQYDIIGSMETSAFSRTTNSWGSHCYFTYILLPNNHPSEQLEAKLPHFIKKYYGNHFLKQTGMSLEEHFEKENGYYGHFLQPLTDIHLNTKIRSELPTRGNKQTIYIFSIAAVLILLIACINFMNLSTARFTNRIKEIGIRKVMGSNKTQLICQFISESIVLSFISLSLAVCISKVALPVFNNIAQKQLEFLLFNNLIVMSSLIGFALLIGIAVGSYPALFLSSFNAVKALKGKINDRKNSNIHLRRGMVIFQFSISIIIIIGTFVVLEQLNFMQTKNLGFTKEQIMVIHRVNTLNKQHEIFANKLLKESNIIGVSSTNAVPGKHFEPNGHRLEGKPATDENTLYTMYSDDQYLKLLDIKLVSGRYFSKQIASDSNSVVINEAAVKKLGLTNPIGKRFHKEFGNAKEGEFVTIIGVIKNIHFHSLHNEIQPMLIRNLHKNTGSYTFVKITPANIAQTISSIKQKWNKLSNGQPFIYSFLDEDLKILYNHENRSVKIFTVFAILSIFITCLGVFGLVSFNIEQRMKEIGIRKVLGASVPKLIFLLSRELFILISIAIIISSPIAFIIIKNWLQNFAYRIHASPLTFFLSIMLVLLISFITIGLRTFRAANINPVQTLKCE